MKANKSLENFFLEPKPVLAPCQVMRWIGWLKKLKLLQKEDKEEWDALDRKNQVDSVLYQTRSNKKSWETMFLVDKEKVEAKVNEVMDAIPGGSTQAIKYAMAVLNQEIM